MTPEPEWVDLGLPSGMLWRNANLGADTPEQIGLYFSWGNTEGHAADAGYDFSQVNYDDSPAASISSDLDATHDAATVMLGASCRMPSQQDFNELNNNCVSTWMRRNGVLGRLYVSNINGRSIFIPAIGYYDGTVRNAYEIEGRYWSNKYFSETNAIAFGETANGVTVQAYGQRHYGYPIRPVRPA